MEHTQNPASVAAEGGAGTSKQAADEALIAAIEAGNLAPAKPHLPGTRAMPPCAPHLRIFGQRLYWRCFYWSLYFRDGKGGSKCLFGSESLGACRRAAIRIANKFQIPVRGKNSGFFRKLKRTNAVGFARRKTKNKRREFLKRHARGAR